MYVHRKVSQKSSKVEILPKKKKKREKVIIILKDCSFILAFKNKGHSKKRKPSKLSDHLWFITWP